MGVYMVVCMCLRVCMQIAVLSVCCAIAIMLAGLLLWWVRKARRRAWAQQELERRKLDEDMSPYGLNTPRSPGGTPGGPMGGVTGWSDPRTGNPQQVRPHTDALRPLACALACKYLV